jgi:predicted DCC family thiol-disulfide oxidoreductase YuxK
MNSEITEIPETKEGRRQKHEHVCPASALETTWREDETLALRTNHSFRGWILYDGACRSCAASSRRFDRIFRRRGFLFLPLQTNWIMERLDLESGAPLEELRVLTADGRNIGGADAVIFLARQIWWTWPFAALAQLPGMHKPLDRGYRWIAAHRVCDHIRCSLEERRSLDRRFRKSVTEKPPLLKFSPPWMPLIAFPILALLVRDRVAPWVFMWLMAAAIFFGCKCLTFSGARKKIVHVRVGRALAYFFLWPGMDAKRFACPTDRQNLTALNRQVLRKPASEVSQARDPRWVSRAAKQLSGNVPSHAGRMPALFGKRRSIVVATAKIFLGAILLFGLARFAPHPLLTGWVGMIGMILVLHFGMFDLLTIVWRAYGLDVRPIMDAPLNSTSLGEFWGRRWNGAFNQLAFENIFRPVARSTGPILGTIVAFLASGLIHELVISLPARTGYGLPTAYFLLQGCGVIIQHRVPRIRYGMAGQFFTAFIVAVPAFWLFHPPFVRNVILPFMNAIGAL